MLLNKFESCDVQEACTERPGGGCMGKQLSAGLLCLQPTLHGTTVATAAAVFVAVNYVVAAAAAAAAAELVHTEDYQCYRGQLLLAAQQQRSMRSTGGAR
jgi:hypothetical protein